MTAVDILVPCYNYGCYLPDCVGSVARQSFRDWKMLIIDDASPDGSAAVAHRLAAADERIEAIAHTTNRGHIATYNEGIERASAEFFMLLSADDMLAPGALERAVSIMRREPRVVFAYGRSLDIRDGEPPPVQADPQQEWRVEPGAAFIGRNCAEAVNLVPTPSVILRTHAQKRAGGYRPTLPHSGDLEMWLRIAILGNVAETRGLQSLKRVHGGNMSTAAADNILQDYLQRADAFEAFFEGPGADMPGATHLHRLVRRRLAGRAFWTSLAQACRGRRATSRDLMRLAWQLRPASVVLPPVWQLVLRARS